MGDSIRQVYDILRDRVAEHDRQAPRRIVCFFDLAESTLYKEARDPVIGLFKVYRHNETVAEEVSRYGGTLVKNLGDGVLAVFPGNAEGDVAAPLLAASRVMDRFLSVNEGIEEAERIISRCGLAAGRVIDFNAVDSEGRQVGDPQGPVVDLAARLCGLARRGQVLCDATVRAWADSTSPSFEFSDPAERPLKGFRRPQGVSALLWSPDSPKEVPHEAPQYHDDGFLTVEFVLQMLREAKEEVVVTGLSHRYYCENFEVRNMLREKIQENPAFTFHLVFLNPTSPYLVYAQAISRRKGELMDIIPRNVKAACRTFERESANVRLSFADYPLAIPLVRKDDTLHFSLPFRADLEDAHLPTLVGGGFFSTSAMTRLGQSILMNLETDRLAPIPIPSILAAETTLEEIMNNGI